VFDIELHKDQPPLRLPYNVTDDPQQAAREFLQLNNVDERFLETVTNYIHNHSSGSDSARDASMVSDTSKGTLVLQQLTHMVTS